MTIMHKISLKIASYTIRVMGKPASDYATSHEFDEANQKVVNDLASALSDAETVINEWLPEGYYCKIED